MGQNFLSFLTIMVFHSNEDMLGKISGRYHRLLFTENLYHTQCIQ